MVLLVMWRLTSWTDFASDDWSYHFFYEGRRVSGHPHRLTGPLEVFPSIASHYRVQNGRSLAHALLQWCTLLGKPWFDLLNALVFVGVGQLVLRHVGASARRVLPAVAVYAAMFVFIPFFGQAALWMAGSVNYLWMAGVTLLTLLPWTRHVPGRPGAAARLPGWAVVALAAVAGLAGGSTNENSAGAWLVVALACMLGWARAGERPPAWSWVGVLMAAVGLAVQLASPGNHARSRRLGGASLPEVLQRMPRLWEVTLESSGWVMAAFVLMLVLRLLLTRRVDADVRRALVWAAAGLASGLIMVVTPSMPHRSWIWTVLFLMIGTGLLGRGLPFPWQRLLLPVVTVPLVAAAVVVLGGAWASIGQTHREVAHTLEQVEEARRAGRPDAVVTTFTRTDNRWNALAWLPNLTADPDGTVNQWFAVYHGLRSVVVDNPDQVRR